MRRALAAAALCLAALPATASGAVTNLERVREPSAVDSSDKVETAVCPRGLKVTGGGGELSGAGALGQVLFRNIRPNEALTNVSVQAIEDADGAAADWSVAAHAICATPPPGLERVAAVSPGNSANKAVTASCPASKKLLGTGGEIAGGAGQVYLDDIRPNASLTGVNVAGMEDENGFAGSWSVTAYAVCANAVAGLERVSATSATNSNGKNATVNCPVGKQAVGAGAELGPGAGRLLSSVWATAGLTAGIAIAGEDENGTTTDWWVRAYLICANASERVATATATNSVAKDMWVGCPAGKKVSGAGADLTGAMGETRFDFEPTSPTNFGASEDADGTAKNWFMRGYVVCTTALPGSQVWATPTATDSSATKSAVVPCPAGERLLSAGAVTSAPDRTIINAIRPSPDLTAATAVAGEDEAGLSEAWQLTGYAICADPPPGLELVTEAGDLDSDNQSVMAACPAGKNLLGLGADLPGALGEVMFDDIRPDPFLTRVTVTGAEDQTGRTGDWFPRAYAICASP